MIIAPNMVLKMRSFGPDHDCYCHDRSEGWIKVVCIVCSHLLTAQLDPIMR
jgi:hypothetical protein